MSDAAMVDGLNSALADGTVFYQKVRHYHWNVRGERFFLLHEKFEKIYTEWADIIDELAERVIALEGVPLHTLASLLDAASLDEDPEISTGEEMVARTVADLEAMHEAFGELLEDAEDEDDRGTANLLDETRDKIEGDLWMLKAWLDR